MTFQAFDLLAAKTALAAKDERIARLIEETIEFVALDP